MYRWAAGEQGFRQERTRVTNGRFKMVRVPVPAWAPAHARGAVKFAENADKYGDAVTSAERDALKRRRDDILALTDMKVEEYVNDGCAPPDEGWFPEQARMTGEFYIGSESYHKLVGAKWCQVCVRVRCLGRGSAGPEDYLGLDIWVRYDPAEDRLWAHRNPDSSVL